MAKDDISMFGKIDRHEERLDEQAEKIMQQEQRLSRLEDQTLRLENTIMSENRETRSTITETNRQLHTLIKELMGYKTGENTLKHSLRMAKLESLSKIVAYLVGSGGFLYVLFEFLATK